MSTTSMKRKADELDDSDDDQPMPGRQVLPVANLGNDFDGVPLDGMQYLFTVRRDARMLPHTTRVQNPYEIPYVPTTSSTDEGESSPSSSNKILPCEGWRTTFLRRFKNFRKNSIQPTIHVHIPDSRAKLVPDKKERDLWWMFLAGRPESEWNPPKKPKPPKHTRWQQRNLRRGVNVGDMMPDILEDNTLPYEPSEAGEIPYSSDTLASSSTVPSLAAGAAGPDTTVGNSSNGTVTEGGICTPRGPTPTLFQHIDHRYAVHLLMYFAHWINLRLETEHLPHTEITQTHAQWIFCLLARVDEWLPSDEISTLRTLARGCIGLMAQRTWRPSEPTQTLTMIDDRSCWIIITAIAGLWGQTDLWIDAESELSKIEPAHMPAANHN